MLEELAVRLPDHEDGLSQDQEYCLLAENGEERRIRFHDYDKVYDIPGLYETIFYELLKCDSPEVVTSLLVKQVEKSGVSPADLDVLDLGAGNGMVGEALRSRGVEKMVGVDIIEEAAKAAERDRPDIYQEYYVGDVRKLSADTVAHLRARPINCMVCVAALGFGDIPASVFQAVYDIVEPGGWLAFNIKDLFLEGDDSDFAALIRGMLDDGRLEPLEQHKYRHRLSVTGEPLEYVAIVARKPRA